MTCNVTSSATIANTVVKQVFDPQPLLVQDPQDQRHARHHADHPRLPLCARNSVITIDIPMQINVRGLRNPARLAITTVRIGSR